jgi:glycosyltransferase involved in cell wall biosynthesis
LSDAILVSLVLPTRNQADHIAGVVEDFRRTLQALPGPFEVILVVNGSRDGTLAACQELARAHPEVRVVESPPGWGGAVKTGIAQARGSLICYTNSARTQPEDLLQLIRYGLVNDRVVVKASRKVRASLLRRLGSVIYNFEVRLLFGLAVWDVNGTPKVFPAALRERLGLTEDGDLIDMEFVVNCKLRAIPIVEVPVYVTERRAGKSTTNLGSAWKMYIGALRAYFRLRSEQPSGRPPA